MRFFPFDDPVHREVAELLPWLANGTLAGVEKAKAARHVSECIACRRELEDLRALQDAIANDDLDSGATQAFAKLKTRIALDQPRSTQHLFDRLASRWHASDFWVRGLLVAQFAVLVLIAGAYLSRPVPQYYHTLAAPAAAARGDVVVVFQATTTEREIRDVLLRVHASIVDGPSGEGAYTLKVREGDPQAVLEQLRRQPEVKFCEPTLQPPRAS
jgi:hypothetical protein